MGGNIQRSPKARERANDVGKTRLSVRGGDEGNEVGKSERVGRTSGLKAGQKEKFRERKQKKIDPQRSREEF